MKKQDENIFMYLALTLFAIAFCVLQAGAQTAGLSVCGASLVCLLIGLAVAERDYRKRYPLSSRRRHPPDEDDLDDDLFLLWAALDEDGDGLPD